MIVHVLSRFTVSKIYSFRLLCLPFVTCTRLILFLQKYSNINISVSQRTIKLVIFWISTVCAVFNKVGSNSHGNKTQMLQKLPDFRSHFQFCFDRVTKLCLFPLIATFPQGRTYVSEKRRNISQTYLLHIWYISYSETYLMPTQKFPKQWLNFGTRILTSLVVPFSVPYGTSFVVLNGTDGPYGTVPWVQYWAMGLSRRGRSHTVLPQKEKMEVLEPADGFGRKTRIVNKLMGLGT